jgi:hypothetical protein
VEKAIGVFCGSLRVSSLLHAVRARIVTAARRKSFFIVVAF